MALIAEVVRILRSSIAGRRPEGRAPGEVYVNFADRKMGWIDPAGNPVDLPYLHQSGGDVEGAFRVKGIFRVMPANADTNPAMHLSNLAGQTLASVEAARDSGSMFLGKRNATDSAWQSRLNFIGDDITMSGLKEFPDSASIMNRARTDARYLRNGINQTLTGSFTVSGSFTVQQGATIDGNLTVKGSTSAENLSCASMTVDGNIHSKSGRLYMDSPANSAAQVIFRNRTGSLNRGLVYAAEDGSYVRLLKYLSSGAGTDVYLNLVAGDGMLVGASSDPVTGNSLINMTRGDRRYVRPSGLGTEIAAMGAGAIGSYGFFHLTISTILDPGDLVSGSNLRWASTTDSNFRQGSAPAGTWMWMSYGNYAGVAKRVS